MDENNNNKTGVHHLLLQLWADDTLLNIRRRELLNAGQDTSNVDRDLARVSDNTAACFLQRDEIITVTDFLIMLNDMTRYNRIAARWLLHQFASARINPILFSSSSTSPPNNPHVLEDWINDLYALLDCLHSRTGCPQIVRAQFSIATVEARLYELELMLKTTREKWLAMMMATDKRWGKDSPLHTLDPDLLKRYLL